MKTTALVLGISTLICAGVQAQMQPQTRETARVRYEQINRETSTYRVVKRELNDRSAEGGQLIGYFQGKAPRKIVTRVFGETGRATQELFFWQGQLFFAIETEWRAQRPLAHPQGRGATTRSQNRFYFRQGRLVSWIDNSNRTVSPTVANYQQTGREVLDSARESLALLRKTS